MMLILYTNFLQEHGGLTYQDDTRLSNVKTTPAREAGITQSKWQFNKNY